MVKRFVIAFGCDVKTVIKWVFRDSAKEWPDKLDSKAELTKFRGLVCHNLKPKPEYVTYTLMTSKLEGFTSVENLSKDNYRYYQFNFSNKEPVCVLWSEKGAKINLADLGEIQITNIDGKEVVCDDTDSIELTAEPIFVEIAEKDSDD